MTRLHRLIPATALVLPALVLAGSACGSPSRPSGLPPPEYREPTVEPWTPPSAAPPAVEAPAAEPPAGMPAGEGPPASPPENDAGSGATLPAGPP